MKALIRGNEIIPEPWSQWVEDHLEWLITPRPNGNGYQMLDGYDPEQHGDLSPDELRNLFCNLCC